MEELNVLKLLEAFSQQIAAGGVSFIQTARVAEREAVADLVTALHSLFEGAGPNEDNLNWGECHSKCTKLWKLLIRIALRDIDEGSKGNVRIASFLDAATQFEETLYGLEPYYRDHTLHSLWVYLLGDFLLRGQLRPTYDDLNWYLYNDVESEPDWADYRQAARDKEAELTVEANDRRDAIWCVIALCHDLGYSLSKLGKINERVERVLGFLDLHRFDRIGYTLGIEQQFLTKQFLELMADDLRIEAGTETDEVLVKLYRDDGSYWRLCESLEKRDHGTLSAFVLYKLLGLFGDATLRGPAEEFGLEDEEASPTLIRGTILYAIAQHQFMYAWADELGSLADVLLLADEAEEFSRYGRPLMTRKYYPTLANVRLGVTYSGSDVAHEVDVVVEYDVHEEQPVEEFFWRKACRLAEVYHVRAPESQGRARIGRPRPSRFPKIARIDSVVRGKGIAEISMTITRDGIVASLPPKGGGNGRDTRRLEIVDDHLHVLGDGEEVRLDRWLGVS